MITLGTSDKLAVGAPPVTTVKVIGVGNAGLAMLARLCADTEGRYETVAMHTDIRTLRVSPAGLRIHLGNGAAGDLGSGGDEALGRTAARESENDIRSVCTGVDVVVLCTGLGGGTGSGAAPFIAQQAKAAGALVIGVACLPFAMEGGRRREQAAGALARLGRHALTVLCFENDRIAEVTSEETSVSEALETVSAILSQAVRALLRMLEAKPVLSVGLDELVQMFRGAEARCHFGYGEATGPDRCRRALEQALSSPLLDGGRMLEEAGGVLVHITGEAALPMAEIQKALGGLASRVASSSQIYLGVSADPACQGEVGVVVMAGIQSDDPVYADSGDDEQSEAEAELTPVEATGTNGSTAAKPAGRRKGGRVTKTGSEPHQVELPLEQAVRGRFKDLDPTVVDGQDLDIPTYIRMRLRIR